MGNLTQDEHDEGGGAAPLPDQQMVDRDRKR